MLNEIIEAGEYLYNFEESDEKPKRIKTKILLKGNSLNGMERSMTMVARFFIYEDCDDLEEGIKRANAALRMWCGLAPEDRSSDHLSAQFAYLEENYPRLDYWIIDYLRMVSKDKGETEMNRAEKAITKINGKQEQFEKSSLNKSASINDFKTIYYDKIISNAITCGPLKRYYLICNKENWDEKVRVKGKKSKNGECSDSQREKIIKLLSAYMIEMSRKKRPEERKLRFEPVGMTDIANWAHGTSTLDKGNFKIYEYSGRSLFVFQKGKSGNMTKMRPDEEWFEECGWKLIESTDDDQCLDAYLENNLNAVFYSDGGANQELKLNTRYIR